MLSASALTASEAPSSSQTRPGRQRVRVKRADDEGEQEHVTERIGEVGGDDGRRALGGTEYRLDDDGAAERAGRQGGGDAVDPDARRERLSRATGTEGSGPRSSQGRTPR